MLKTAYPNPIYRPDVELNSSLRRPLKGFK